MTDYAAYRENKSITNGQFIETLNGKFEGFTKIQSTNISKPWKYAVCLTQEAEDVLVERYGIGPGLAHYKPPKKRRADKRTKPNRMMVRLDDSMYARVMSLMHRLNFNTAQDFLEATLKVMVEREEMEYDKN